MSKTLYLEVANFTLRFGYKLVLLDMLQEIVIPAFVSNWSRESRSSTLLFHDVKLVNTTRDGRDFPAIAGRIVKLMTVGRQRLFDRERNELIDEPIDFPSSPASMFVLILETHKLLYVKEEPNSPGIEAFGNTAERFLVNAYRKYIDDQYIAAKVARKEGDSRVTKKKLREDVPEPSLEVIEIADRQTLKEFIGGFRKITKASMTLIETNDESSDNEFIDHLRKKQAALNAKRLTLQGSDPDGMDKEEVVSTFGAASDGNAKVNFSGIDEDDNTLSGNNQRFKLKINLNVESLSQDVPAEARELIGVYQRLVEAGDIKESPLAIERQRLLSHHAKNLFTD